MAKTKKGASRAAKTLSRKVTSGAKKAAKRVKAAKAPRRAALRPAMRTITPYLAVSDGSGAIEWYKKAFGAKEVARMPAGDKLMHAEIRIGDSSVFLSDLFPGTPVKDPKESGPSVTIHLWHRNVDKLWKQAVDAGARVVMPLDDQFWGDRYGQLLDPYGHLWSLSHKSKLGKAELERKRQEAMKQFPGMAAPPA